MLPVNITDDTVTAVAGKLSGGARPGGTDLVSLQYWILRFGSISGELRLIVGDFTEWLGNWRTPWAAYRALMSSRLIVVDKQIGIRLVRLGETWRRMIAKCLLWVLTQEAKSACGTVQLDRGV